MKWLLPHNKTGQLLQSVVGGTLVGSGHRISNNQKRHSEKECKFRDKWRYTTKLKGLRALFRSTTWPFKILANQIIPNSRVYITHSSRSQNWWIWRLTADRPIRRFLKVFLCFGVVDNQIFEVMTDEWSEFVADEQNKSVIRRTEFVCRYRQWVYKFYSDDYGCFNLNFAPHLHYRFKEPSTSRSLKLDLKHQRHRPEWRFWLLLILWSGFNVF